MQGMVFNVQRFCINDGPGIRTTVFFKGCPLRCRWCHNPESHILAVENMCENGQDEPCGRYMTVDEVMDEVMKDQVFYDNSNGGLTLSGGEPLMQAAFAYELLKRAKAQGLHTCVETCGFANAEDMQRIAPLTDMFLYDWKVTDGELHKTYTGVDNLRIRENLRYIDTTDAKIVLRCPIVPQVNDTANHFHGIADLANSLQNIVGVEIEPYHALGNNKYAKLGKAGAVQVFPQPTEEQVAAWIAQLQEYTNVPVKKA